MHCCAAGLKYCEWESKFAGLPYYIFDAGHCSARQIPKPEELPYGIHVIRNSPVCLEGYGYQFLDTMLTLATRQQDFYPALYDSSIQIVDASIHGTPNGEAHYFAFRSIGMFSPSFRKNGLKNRLYATLPTEGADQAMRDWVDNCFNGTRAQKIGIARVDGRCAGFVALRHEPTRGSDWIELMAVVPEMQGKGVGRALAQWAATWVDHHTLSVRTEYLNTASLRAYQSAGFRVVGHSNEYWTIKGYQ